MNSTQSDIDLLRPSESFKTAQPGRVGNKVKTKWKQSENKANLFCNHYINAMPTMFMINCYLACYRRRQNWTLPFGLDRAQPKIRKILKFRTFLGLKIKTNNRAKKLTSYSVGEITRKPSNRPLISVKDEMKRGSWNVEENQNSDNYHRNRNDGMPLPAMVESGKTYCCTYENNISSIR